VTKAERNKGKRIRRLRRKYGLTPEQLEAMKVAQEYKCAICRRRPRRLVVDHSHDTGKIRGLLCVPCNANLGWFEIYPKQVRRYLRNG